MRKPLPIEELSAEAFAPFGEFRNMLQPSGLAIGEPPVTFFRDMIQQPLGESRVSYSVCRCEPRPFRVDTLEHHDRTAELLLPLDNDVLIQVAPATPKADGAPLRDVRIFRVPRGTMVILRQGTWHHAPYALHDKPVNVLVALPERTYANDTTLVELGDDTLEIEV